MSDWSPLAGSNPIPGRPEAMHELAGRMESTRSIIDTQVGRISGFDADGFWTGDAADQFREQKGDLPEKLQMLAERYRRAAGALRTYAPELDEAQQMARRALADARQAEADMQRAEAGVDDMENHEQGERTRSETAAGEGEPYTPQPYGGPNWRSLLGQANDDMDAARELLRQAEQVRDDAARKCGDEIGDACDDGLENEGGLFAGFKRAVTSVVDALPIEEIAQVLTVVSVIVGVAAIFFPVLAPLALALGAATLLLDSMLAISGDGSWTNVGLDALGIATFGLGRVFGAAARGSSAIGAADDAVNTARAGVTATEATVDGARSAQAALGARTSMAGMSAVSNNGNRVYGAVARNVLNARYNAQIRAGEQALQSARGTLGTAEAGLTSAQAAMRPGALMRNFFPSASEWGSAGRATLPQNWSSTFQNGGAAAGEWASGLHVPQNAADAWGLGSRGMDVAGTALGGYQTVTVGQDVFGGAPDVQPIPVPAN
jgi:hypothetical protein